MTARIFPVKKEIVSGNMKAYNTNHYIKLQIKIKLWIATKNLASSFVLISKINISKDV